MATQHYVLIPISIAMIKMASPRQLIEGRVYLVAYSSRWKRVCHGEKSWKWAGMAGSWVLWFPKTRMKQRGNLKPQAHFQR